MENKLPKVGKIYRIRFQDIYKCNKIFEERYVLGYDKVVEMKNLIQNRNEIFRLKGFFKLFEEIPDHISQEEKKVDKVEMKNTWQPIDTAPKDGTEILVYSKPWKNNKGLCGGGITQAYYRGLEDKKTPWWTKVNPVAVYPTHWQPLPQPPKED